MKTTNKYHHKLRLKDFLCYSVFFPHLLTSRGKLVRVRGQCFKVIRDCLEVSDLSQQRNFLILKEKKNNLLIRVNFHHLSLLQSQQKRSIYSFLVALLTTTGRNMATKQQILCLCSIRAFLSACFSVSSSRMNLSLTSCLALSSWGWISPRPSRKRTAPYNTLHKPMQ